MKRNNVDVVGGHLLKNTTKGKDYGNKFSRFGQWIVDDAGERVLISNSIFKKFFK